MEVQEQNQTFMEVKQEAPEEQQKTSNDDNEEDQPPVSKLLISTQNPHDSSPKIKLRKRPYASKEGTVPIKRKRSGSRFETNRMVSDNPKKSKHCKRKTEIVDNSSEHTKAQSSPVMERAKDVQTSLTPLFPSFIKLMLRSHVTKGFWLGLPSEFCKLHMPRGDETIVLEDESGKKYKTNFLVDKWGLSGGWKGFSTAQNLLEGDVVVFHLVEPCKFKVYIVRANDLDVTDVPHLLPNFLQENVEENHTMARQFCPRPVTDQSKHDGKNIPSSGIEGFKLSRPISDFKNFTIVVNGLTVDSELSKRIREKYYDLCCTRKSYLHNGLLKTINSTMAAGIISETTNLADAIRACKISTSQDDFATWEKTLEALEMLGMDVGFLRARLNQLMGLALISAEAPEWKRYEEARGERDRVDEEIGFLERKILKLKQGRSTLSDKMEALMENVQRYMVLFQEEANAPW